MCCRIAALAFLATAALVPARARAFAPVEVTVHERDGVARHGWPLTVSVPFSRGELSPGTAVKAVDERGAAVPTQSRPLVTWPDGSVRWLLLDTVVDLKPGQARHLRVQAGAPRMPTVAVHTTESDDAILVDTGAVAFAVPKRRFAIVDAVRLHGSSKGAGGALQATIVADDSPLEAQPPVSVAVKENGPLRTRLELEGTYGSGFDYVVRIEAYAGQPFVRVWHTFINRHPPPYSSLARMSLDFALPELHLARYRYGLVGKIGKGGHLAAAGLRLYQSDNTAYALDGKTHPGQLSGWIELSGTQATVGIAARWLWEQYPQSFSARPDRLEYNLWAPEAPPANAGVGVAKTHELVVWAAPTKRWAAGASRALVRPLLGVVNPAWVARSGALPQAISPLAAGAGFTHTALEAARRYAKQNSVERWDECGAVHCTPGSERPRIGAYGMWNWGDWNFPGYHDTTQGTDSWGNQEYDTAYVLALTYAASGDEDVHDMLVAAARHFIDVDTIHACPARPKWIGMNHPKTPLHFAFELGGPDLGHTWTQGSLAYYYLTGDERGLAAARAIADYLVQRARNFARGNPRQWGWPQIALLAVYDATGERAYLDAALVYARGGMRAHPPTTSTQWKLGILADALAYTHAATGDSDIRAWLEQYANAVMQRVAHEDTRAFPAVAYIAALSGDPAMRAAARDRADRLDLGSWGKPYSINGRIGFRIESLLPANAPPTVPKSRPGGGRHPHAASVR